jgi:hypothetical protein
MSNDFSKIGIGVPNFRVEVELRTFDSRCPRISPSASFRTDFVPMDLGLTLCLEVDVRSALQVDDTEGEDLVLVLDDHHLRGPCNQQAPG